jgi:stage III sporulation protein AH
MVPVIIKKRTLTLVALCVMGLALLLLGWRGDLLDKKNSNRGVQVTGPATGVNFENSGQSLFGENKSADTGIKATAKNGSDFFVEYRLERERTRGQQVEWLREVINNANSTVETRQKAQEHLMTVSRSMEKEVELENLLRAKGFKDAAVQVDDRTVTCIVSATSLSGDEALRVTELISRGTGVEAQNIVIIPKP